MKKSLFSVVLFSLCHVVAHAQGVGIGTTAPDNSALLETRAINKGFLVPRLNTGQVTNIVTPAKGLMVYDSVLNRLMINVGSPALPNWQALFNDATGWGTAGNAAITPSNYLGTNTAQPLIFKTGGAENLRLTETGRFGIGAIAPAAKVQIEHPSTGPVPHLTLRETQSYIPARLRFNNSNEGSRGWEMRGLMDTADGDNDRLDIFHQTGQIGNFTLGANALTVRGNGRVGIGTVTPSYELEVKHDNTSTIAISGLSSSDTSQLVFSNFTPGSGPFPLPIGTTFTMASRGSNGLLISSSTLPAFNFRDIMHMSTQGVVSIRDGGRLAVENANGNVMIDMTPTEAAGQGAAISLFNISNVETINIDADNGPNHRGRIILDEIQIKGGADFAEDFRISTDADDAQPLPGMLVSINPAKEGSVCITSEKMDRKVVGVISGANGIMPGMLMGQKGSIAYGEHPVALAGRVYVLTTIEGGDIEPGDFITSSSSKGYAMKVNDLAKAQGTMIGKAMSRRDPKSGFVLVLINLQ